MLKILINLKSDVIDILLVKKTIDKKNLVAIDVIDQYSFPSHSDLALLIKEIKKSKIEKIEEIVCILGPSYSTSKTSLVHQKYDKPVVVTQKLLDSLLSENMNEASLEKSPLYVAINGYETKLPLGKEAVTLDMTIFESKTSAEIIEEITNTFSPLSKNIVFCTLPLLLFRTMPLFIKDDSNFVFMEIEKKTTSISFIRQNAYLESASFPIGNSNILDSLKKNMNLDDTVAMSFIKMKQEKTLEQGLETKLDSCVKEALMDWQRELSSATATLSHGVILPSVCYLIGDESFFGIYKQVLSQDNWNIKTVPVPLYSLIYF